MTVYKYKQIFGIHIINIFIVVSIVNKREPCRLGFNIFLQQFYIHSIYILLKIHVGANLAGMRIVDWMLELTVIIVVFIWFHIKKII